MCYFPKSLDESNQKLNKIWVDKGSKFYNRSTRSWLGKNVIEMYSTHINLLPIKDSLGPQKLKFINM